MVIENKLLTVKEVSKILRYNPNKIYQLIKEQKLMAHRLDGKGYWRITEKDLNDFLNRGWL